MITRSAHISFHVHEVANVSVDRTTLSSGNTRLSFGAYPAELDIFLTPEVEARLIAALTQKFTTNQHDTEAEKDPQGVRTQADRGIDGCSAERQNDREIPAASTHGPESEAA